MHQTTPKRVEWFLGAIALALILGNALQLAGLYFTRGRTGTCTDRPAPPPPLMALARPMPPEKPPDRSKPGWPGLRSPDSNWELFQWIGRSGDCTVVARDGSRSIVRKTKVGEFWASASNAIWTPDSRSWVRLMAGEKSLYVVVQSLDAVALVRKISIGYPKWTVMTYWPGSSMSERGRKRVLRRTREAFSLP
jgi:hypothetical protein